MYAALRNAHRRKVPCITMCPCDFYSVTFFLEHSGTFCNIMEHSGTFCNLLEPSGSLEPSEFQLVRDRRTDGRTYISTSRAAPSQLKTSTFIYLVEDNLEHDDEDDHSPEAGQAA